MSKTVKKNKRVRVSVSAWIALLILLSFVAPIFADWIPCDPTGSWNNATQGHFSGTLNNELGEMVFSYDVVNFSGLRATVNFTDLRLAYRNWWDMESDKKVWIDYIIRGDDGTNIASFNYFHEVSNTWGIIRDRQVQTAFLKNVSSQGQFSLLEESWQINAPKGYGGQYFGFYEYGVGNTFDIQLWRVGNNVTTLVLYHRADGGASNLLVNSTVDMGADFFTACHVDLVIRHEGYGWFEGYQENIVYDNTPYTPMIPSANDLTGSENIGFFGQLSHDLFSIVSSVVPRSVLDTVGTFSQWSGQIFSVLSAFLLALAVMLPFVPILLIFYGVDVGVTSVMTGSFTPVGVFASAIYQVVSGAAHTLIAVAQAIYDFIHFW